jgi:hypothetical protein
MRQTCSLVEDREVVVVAGEVGVGGVLQKKLRTFKVAGGRKGMVMILDSELASRARREKRSSGAVLARIRGTKLGQR